MRKYKMSTKSEIEKLEEELRQAELGPDAAFFERHIDDAMVFVASGQASKPKKQIVEAHKPGQGQGFSRVEMTEMEIIDHGNTAVVICTGQFDGDRGAFELKFMRVWAKSETGWKIVAGAMIG
jgi:ketosteroid isomerase-like protein